MFRFKQFAIRQEKAAMKIGTDAVLLGCLAEHSQAHTILDIGCGSGIIGLMLAQRFPKALITQLDIDKGAIEDTVFNQTESKFTERMCTIHGNYLEHHFDQSFDLIVCNPPFHPENSRSKETIRDQARHSSHLPILELLRKSASILTKNGVLFLIVPDNQRSLIEQGGVDVGLFLQSITTIQPKQDKPVNRIIMSLGKQNVKLLSSNFTVRNDDNSYSEAYKILTSDFHLPTSKV